MEGGLQLTVEEASQGGGNKGGGGEGRKQIRHLGFPKSKTPFSAHL